MNFIPNGSKNTRDVMGVYDADNNDIRPMPAMKVVEEPATLPAATTKTKSKTAKSKTSSTKVFCKVLFEGIHNWPTCDIEEVSYLKLPHRHIFHITCYAVVTHMDRDLEFIVLKHKVEKWLLETYPNGHMGATSCEQLAWQLINKFNLVQCTVSEDGENGAAVTID